MKLYLTPGACSQAPHIALNEAGLPYEIVKVDIPTRRTEAGDDYTEVNPKGYVPALVLDDGTVITENVAILTYIAEREPSLMPAGDLGRIRLIEALGFLAEEVHKPYLAYMFLPGEEMKAISRNMIEKRYDYLAEEIRGEYLFGDRFSSADAMLFVMASWGHGFGIGLPSRLQAYHERVAARPAVQATLRKEGLA